jgi:glycosyltransferase involved in cell wall biosynthesis
MNLSHRPRLSIGLPVYNGEPFLAQAIESLIGQTFADFRLIISDNASTDRTPEICRAYGRRDPRIIYHRRADNRGAAWNFNHVVHLADSEYFKWAAYDDVCAPEFIERCVDVLDRRPRVVLCYTKSAIIDEHGTVLSAYDNRVNATAATPFERFRDVLTHLSLCHMLFGVIRLDVLRRTQLHGAYPTADMILLAELALRGEFFEVAQPLFLRRDHPARPRRAYRTPAEFAAWFDPGSSGPIRFLRWTRFVNHLRAIARAPIGLDQKLRCVSFMVGRPLRRWGLLPRAA